LRAVEMNRVGDGLLQAVDETRDEMLLATQRQ